MSFLTKPVENFAHWAASSHKKRIYEFHEASTQDKDLLGVKGADLCELSRIGLPIPPGFVITTETCVDYFHLNKTKSEIDYFVEDKKMPDNLQRAMENAVRDIEKKTKMTFGASHNGEMPLLLAIRAGAAMPMPGMMDTVLNVGINDGCVLAITECTGNRRFALDLHRRFLQMFGTTVLKVSHQEYESRLADAMSRDGVDSDTQLSTDSLIYLIGEFKSLSPVPEDPHVQLLMVVEAIFCSWFSDRARKHRQRMEIEEEMGAAVMVQAMVYGNRNSRSGVGIAYSRNPETGEHHVFGEYLRKGEGDDIAHTAQAPAPIQDLRFTNAHALEQIAHFLALLENNYRDAQLIEFTIDDGQLYVLERKPVKKSPLATLRIAVDMVKCKLLSEREAIMKVDPLQMVYFLSPMIDPVHTYANVDVLGIGSKSSAGAVSGKAVFTTDDAKELRNMGVTNVLILDDLFPADVDDLNYADAVLVMHGGVTSPAAEMARGLIIPAVTALHGCGMAVNVRKHCVEKDGDVSINRHDDITVDGSNGRVIRGVVPTVQAGMDNNFLTIMKWAQKYKKMGVFCTAKNLDEATKALDLGADGLGMYRTETVLTKAANRDLLLGILLGATKMDREKYLELMEDELCTEIQAVFHMFEGKEVSIRLLDPSLNQILPRTGEQIAELAKKLEMTEAHVVRQVQLLTQSNPDIGLRGCRLGILYPELVEMQTRAILRAAVKVKQSGDASPRVQLLVPMVSTDHEIEDIAPVIKSAAAEFFSSADEVVSFVIGSSLDVPRACMRANAIAGEGDVAFLSINTDLLTELTYGMSRHDSSRLIDSYTRIGIMKRDPFISLDRNGVGSLLKIAKNLIRRSNRFIRVGVCGEQSGDPASIEFYDSLGMDYVSCHHFLIPTAKVAAAQAHITSAQRESVWNKALHEGQHF